VQPQPSILPQPGAEQLWATPRRPEACWKRRGGLLSLQEPLLIPSCVEGTGSGSQPRLPPLPGNPTAMSDADNVRGQEATHLKPYLECRVEARGQRNCPGIMGITFIFSPAFRHEGAGQEQGGGG